MLRIWLMAALLVAVSLSGCFGNGGDDERTGDDTGMGVGDDNETGNQTLTVLWVDLPDDNDTMPFTVSWSVEENGTDMALVDLNATTIDETGVAYGFMSVMSPMGPEDYDNVTGVQNNTTAGTFDAEIDAEGNGTLYFRAYAYANGSYHWSPEAMFNLTGNGSTTNGTGALHEIMIEEGSGGLGYLASYEPDTLTIKVGDAVVWNNTATNDQHSIVVEGPQDHETGAIAGGASSDPIVFTMAGEYTFECATHPTMDGGTITVTE